MALSATGRAPAAQAARWDSIQLLRALAANLVVLNHVYEVERRFAPGAALMPDYFRWAGLHGVALFFVISGFVIVQAAGREDWRAFLYARVTRIYPLYWIYTTALLAGYWIAPEALSDRSGTSLLASYLLWPQAQPPLLTVGWTLIHEMYFYLVIAAALLLRLPLAPLLALWTLALLAIEPPAAVPHPALAIALSPFTLLFIFGGVAGLLARRWLKPARADRPGWLRAGVALGDASYSTYLAHVLVVAALWRIGVPLGAPNWLLIGVSVIAANAVGLLSYALIERPLLRVCRRHAPPPLAR